MKRISLTINGQRVSGHAGQTLLQVAQRHGIAIPTLCNHPGLAPAGACRVCIVEVEGYPRPLPACATRRKRVCWSARIRSASALPAG